ncbi:hypothetical protein [Pseudofrankia asymbiotica]|uniref:Uncharacterized protein n=1 Tax=Pseudofrankia asymbiotica TaxID=1834516 RepID=A0A1V2IJM3_9ACTN|nr:hypothetical protein [Pseudofrankia asymbiotica]ONH33393.1 hypothetical protein BL253_02155 [Pseudofrankia asymbiotica]
MRDQLRWAAEVIAAANDKDLLSISAADDAPELSRHGAHRLAAGRLPATRRPADPANRWHRPPRPVSDGV